MPWKEKTTMSLRREFVELARREGSNIRMLCRRFGISPTTGYKWLQRSREGDSGGLRDQSRRPKTSPTRTPHVVEKTILKMRDLQPAWGGRKLRRRLQNLGFEAVPAASTITDILRRHGRLASEIPQAQKWQRFEEDEPNALWQMDFKGDFALRIGRCYPLTLLDDHSRFSLGIFSCSNQQRATVRGHLSTTFRRYGMPLRILTDNGPPWRAMGEKGLTRLSAWLISLGIRLSRSRPRHPQTLGKDERFHRSLKAEVLSRYCLLEHGQCQEHFDRWRDVYNFERPHEALGLEVPGSRYRESLRSFPESLPEAEYGPDDQIRKVGKLGRISFHNRRYRVSRALVGQLVALRPTSRDGRFDVFFHHHRVTTISCHGEHDPGPILDQDRMS